MTASILSGIIVRDSIIPELIKKIQTFSNTPTLAIIQVGDRADSTTFISAKKAFAKKIGITEKHIQLPENISEKEIISKIQECNNDLSISAIIVQLPLPKNIDRDTVINIIDPAKDADGLTSDAKVIPATARGIRELLKYYKVSLSEKKVTVIGRSMLVGTPIAKMCREQGAIVTVCHRGTVDLAKETIQADVIISAVGSPNLIRREHVKSSQVIIDVGISKNQEGLLVGDVDFEAVKDIVNAITPVPGGVGPMTVCGLFENVIDLCGIASNL